MLRYECWSPAFKLTETARLIRAARLAGLTVGRVTTDVNGRPVLIIGDADGEPSPEPPRDTSCEREVKMQDRG